MSRIADMRGALATLPSRDRRALLIATPVIVALLAWLLAVQPLLRAHAAAQTDYREQLQRLHDATVHGSPGLDCARAVDHAKGDLGELARAHGVALQPVTGERRATLSGASADSMLAFAHAALCAGVPLAELQIEHGSAEPTGTLQLEALP